MRVTRASRHLQQCARELQNDGGSGRLGFMPHYFQRFLLCLPVVCGLAACLQSLPEAADFDKYYARSEQLAKEERAEVERQHANGSLNDFAYRQELARINDNVDKRALEMALTAQTLEKKRRESLGLPTADHPLSLAAPGAGSLPTGSDYRMFNQRMGDASGGAGQTVNEMRGLMGSAAPGSRGR